MNNVKIIGAGMTKFVKPGSQLPYRIMASNAVESALKDADIDKKH
ncbi:MAG: sterol carrier protein 2, partial [Alteromonas macleodii]